jgi:hypothetical protein
MPGSYSRACSGRPSVQSKIRSAVGQDRKIVILPIEMAIIYPTTLVFARSCRVDNLEPRRDAIRISHPQLSPLHERKPRLRTPTLSIKLGDAIIAVQCCALWGTRCHDLWESPPKSCHSNDLWVCQPQFNPKYHYRVPIFNDFTLSDATNHAA